MRTLSGSSSRGAAPEGEAHAIYFSTYLPRWKCPSIFRHPVSCFRPIKDCSHLQPHTSFLHPLSCSQMNTRSRSFLWCSYTPEDRYRTLYTHRCLQDRENCQVLKGRTSGFGPLWVGNACTEAVVGAVGVHLISSPAGADKAGTVQVGANVLAELLIAVPILAEIWIQSS